MNCLICNAIIEDFNEDEPRICMKHWKCPKCGVGTEYIDEDGNEMEGLILEDLDYISCMKCETTWTTKRLEKAIMRKTSMVKCPFCHGQGTVQTKKVAKFKGSK